MSDLWDEALATFSATVEPPPTGYVRRVGKIFECGDYPEQKFSLTEEEADKAIAAFTPVKADIEHRPTILDGKLGELRRVWRDGKALFGAADVPEWLVQTLDDAAVSVSASWDRATKTLKGYGLVLEPAIDGAALLAEFSKYNASHGKDKATQPATTKGSNRLTTLRTFLRDKFANFSSQQDTQDVEGTDGKSPEQPAATQPATTTPPATEPAANADRDRGDESEDKATADFKANQMLNQARKDADDLIGSGYLRSSGRKAATALFSQLALDNEESGPATVNFSRGSEIVNDRVELLREVMKHTSPHALFSRSLPVTAYNGDRSQSEKDTAAEQGKKQAASFVESTLPAGHQNGHTNGR